MTWVADEARIEALVYRDGPVVWRNLKVNIREAITEYTNIYSLEGTQDVQYTNCDPVNENCVRVRAIPATGVEDVPTLSLTFTLEVYKGEIVRQDSLKKQVTVEEMCKAFLKPIFKTLPRRRPKILLPAPAVS